jgi:hypothetical protein
MSGANGSSDNSKVAESDSAQVGTGQIAQGGQLWLRRWKLTIGDVTGQKALDLTSLYFTFSVRQQQIASPWSATIMVYNVGNDLLNKIDVQKEYTNVSLEAGYYSGQYGVVFAGPIVYYRSGRKDATDTFIEIYAVSVDEAFSVAYMNHWLPAGHVKQDVLNACLMSLAPFGVTMGQITELAKTTATRGRTLFGMTSGILRDIARSEDAQWFIDGDKNLHLLKMNESLDASAGDEVPVLNSKSGMIGVPEQTLGGGINVKCLLNPAIRPGKVIQINERIVQYNPINPGAGLNPQLDAQLTQGQDNLRGLGDGFYVVGSVEHTGESRGNTWYSNITTVAYNQPESQAGQVSPAGPGH